MQYPQMLPGLMQKGFILGFADICGFIIAFMYLCIICSESFNAKLAFACLACLISRCFVSYFCIPPGFRHT